MRTLRTVISLLLVLIASPLLAAIGPKTFVADAHYVYGATSTGRNVLAIVQTARGLSLCALGPNGTLAAVPQQVEGVYYGLASSGTETVLLSRRCASESNCAIEASWRDDTGNVLGTPAVLVRTTSYPNAAVAPLPDGNFVVAWSTLNDGLRVGRLRPRASTITDARVITPFRVGEVSLATNGENVLLAWQKLYPVCMDWCQFDSTVRATVLRTDLSAGRIHELDGQRISSIAPSDGGAFRVATERYQPTEFDAQVTRVDGSTAREEMSSPARDLLVTKDFTAWTEMSPAAGVRVFLAEAPQRFPATTVDRISSHFGFASQIVDRGDDALLLYVDRFQLFSRTLRRGETPRVRAPGALRLQSVASGDLATVTVHWAPSADAKLYRVIALPTDDPAARVVEFEARGSEDSAVLSLPPETPFVIRVIAENDAGRSESSEPLEIRTDGATPRAPIGLRVTHSLNGLTTVTWRDVSDQEIAYEIVIRDFATGIRLPANSTSYTFPTTLPIQDVFPLQVRAIGQTQSTLSRIVLVDPAPPAIRPRSVIR